LPHIRIEDAAGHVGEEVEIRGWVYNKRSSGKVRFLIIRDGTGFMQSVAAAGNMAQDGFELTDSVTQESSVIVHGTVRADSRAPGGHELLLTGLKLVALAEEYPLALKEHGTDFLMDHRHLWLRTPRQHAIMRVRSEVIRAIRDWLDDNGFILIDTPILTPAACEGTTTLFETTYFEEKAYLAQSGQLYNEADIGAFGRVYCFGPTFRAEKSKTRRHLTEFWMVEPEAAFCDFEENMVIQENLVSFIVSRVLERRAAELETIGRDIEPLKRVKPPFARVTYDEAIDIINKQGAGPVSWGDDFGAPHETAVARAFDKPVFVMKYPAAIKAFYMKPDAARPEVVLGSDLLAPEGYGEIIGGGERIDEKELLIRRIREHNLPMEAFKWYIDLRRYGAVPHSGFGLGIERSVAWICNLEHVRETIPFPRLLNRMYP
jgi:asparaginyl-tRNA synthetase